MNHLCVLIALLGVTSGRFVPDKNNNSESLEALIEVEEFSDDEGLIGDDILESPFRLASTRFNQRWSNGEVPYAFGDTYTATQKAKIEEQFRQLEDYTKHGNTYCIRMVPRRGHKHYINIKKLGGCFSFVGNIKRGPQDYSLADSCIPSSVVHETMHALGFFHEHTRPDRDNYVTINVQNIITGVEDNFVKKKPSDVTILDTKYDFDSVMHYAPNTFSKENAGPTIVPKVHAYVGGLRKELGIPMSKIDVIRVQRYYNCTEDLTNYNKLSKRDTPFLCDFEKDTCGLTQSTTDDFNWSRKQLCKRHNPDETAGDHTYGDGHFLQAITDNRQNQKATVTTPDIEGGSYILAFAYYAKAEQGTGTILITWAANNRPGYVYTYRKSVDNKEETTVWKNIRLRVNMGSTFRASITIDVGSIKGGTILVDDMVIRKK